MELFVGCVYCDRAADCMRSGKPADDCPVEAADRAYKELREAVGAYIYGIIKIVGCLINGRKAHRRKSKP